MCVEVFLYLDAVPAARSSHGGHLTGEQGRRRDRNVRDAGEGRERWKAWSGKRGKLGIGSDQ
jgi:hypothetical protein